MSQVLSPVIWWFEEQTLTHVRVAVSDHARRPMFRLMIILGVVIVLALTTTYILVILYREHNKPKPTMTNNEYDNYPQD